METPSVVSNLNVQVKWGGESHGTVDVTVMLTVNCIPNMQLQLLDVRSTTMQLKNYFFWPLEFLSQDLKELDALEVACLEGAQSPQRRTPAPYSTPFLPSSPPLYYCPLTLHVPKKRNRNDHENFLKRNAREAELSGSDPGRPASQRSVVVSDIQQLSPCSISGLPHKGREIPKASVPAPKISQIPRMGEDGPILKPFLEIHDPPKFSPADESPLRLSELMSDANGGLSCALPTKAPGSSTNMDPIQMRSNQIDGENDEQHPVSSSNVPESFTSVDSMLVPSNCMGHMNEKHSHKAESSLDMKLAFGERCSEPQLTCSGPLTDVNEDLLPGSPMKVAGSFTPVDSPTIPSKSMHDVSGVRGPALDRGISAFVEDVKSTDEYTPNEYGSKFGTDGASDNPECVVDDELELAPSPSPSSQNKMPWHSTEGLKSSACGAHSAEAEGVAHPTRDSTRDPDLVVDAHSLIFRSGANAQKGRYKVIFSFSALLESPPETQWLFLAIPGLPHADHALKGKFSLNVPDGQGFEIATSIFDNPKALKNGFQADFTPAESLGVLFRASLYQGYVLRHFDVQHEIKQNVVVSQRHSVSELPSFHIAYHAICSIKPFPNIWFFAESCSFSITVEGGPEGRLESRVEPDTGCPIIHLGAASNVRKGITRIDLLWPVEKLELFGINWQIELDEPAVSFWAPQIRPFISPESATQGEFLQGEYGNFDFQLRPLCGNSNISNCIDDRPEDFATTAPVFEEFEDDLSTQSMLSPASVSCSEDLDPPITTSLSTGSPSPSPSAGGLDDPVTSFLEEEEESSVIISPADESGVPFAELAAEGVRSSTIMASAEDMDIPVGRKAEVETEHGVSEKREGLDQSVAISPQVSLEPAISQKEGVVRAVGTSAVAESDPAVTELLAEEADFPDLSQYLEVAGPCAWMKRDSPESLEKRLLSATKKFCNWLLLAIMLIFTFSAGYEYSQINPGLMNATYGTPGEIGHSMKQTAIHYGVKAANNTFNFLDKLYAEPITEEQHHHDPISSIERESTSKTSLDDEVDDGVDDEVDDEFYKNAYYYLPPSFREFHGLVCEESVGCLRILQMDVDHLTKAYFLDVMERYGKSRPIDRHRGPLTVRDQVDYALGWQGPIENDLDPHVLRFHAGYKRMTKSGPVIEFVK